MSDEAKSKEAAAWHAHNVEQLLYFRSLSLREKFEAVEGMADVVRLIDRMRESERAGAAPRTSGPSSQPLSED